MTDIYVDASGARTPDAVDRLTHLLEAGHGLFLVGDGSAELVRALPRATHVAALPDEPARGSWYVTADPAACAERRAGLRTLLIGPTRGPGALRGPRCDAEARDLGAAVLEILARDAMG